jgi:Zn-dependent protease
MARLRIPFCMHRTGWILVLLCVVLGVRVGGWQFGILEGALFLSSLLLHEAGHLLAAAFLGVPVREFGLELRGAYIKRAHATCRRDEILIAASGPLMNLLVVVPVMYLPHLGPRVALCNLVLCVINLLPLPSSDGMRILRNLSASITASNTNPAMSSVHPR